jgi:hypothetical protein
MSNLTNKKWWGASLTRAIKTVCQTAVGLVGTNLLFADVNWITVVSASLLAGLLSILTSIAGLPEVGENE